MKSEKEIREKDPLDVIFVKKHPKKVYQKRLTRRNIPSWCHYHEDLEKDNKICCLCGTDIQFYQRGDGKVLHNLCMNCYYIRLKLKDWKIKE